MLINVLKQPFGKYKALWNILKPNNTFVRKYIFCLFTWEMRPWIKFFALPFHIWFVCKIRKTSLIKKINIILYLEVCNYYNNWSLVRYKYSARKYDYLSCYTYLCIYMYYFNQYLYVYLNGNIYLWK